MPEKDKEKILREHVRTLLDKFEARRDATERFALDSFHLMNGEKLFVNEYGALVIRNSLGESKYFEDLVKEKDGRIQNPDAAVNALKNMRRMQDIYVAYLNLNDPFYFGIRPVGNGEFSFRDATIVNPMPIEAYENDRSERPGCLPALPKGTRYVIRISGINEKDLIPLSKDRDIERLKVASGYDPKSRGSLEFNLAGRQVNAVVVKEIIQGNDVYSPIGFYLK